MVGQFRPGRTNRPFLFRSPAPTPPYRVLPLPNAFYPSLIELNTRVLLNEVGPRATLDDLPDALPDRLASQGFDWVWLLGVWQTGPAGRQVSREKEEWRRAYAEALPGFTEDDVCGSPFAVHAYTVHEDFGGDAALARLRERFRGRGLHLLLDVAPNHTALDHPWVQAHPEYYIHGSDEDLAASRAITSGYRPAGPRRCWPTAATPTFPAGPTRCN